MTDLVGVEAVVDDAELGGDANEVVVPMFSASARRSNVAIIDL